MYLLFAAGAPGLELLEEVVALVVNKDESGEVFNRYLPNGFHTEFGVLDTLDALDAALTQNGCHTTNRAKIEAAMLLAGIGDLLRTVALCYHHEAAAICLELIDVWVHTACRGGSHRTARIAGWRLSWSSIENGMVFEVLRHSFACIETSFELGMSDVASHNNGAAKVDTGGDGVFAELGANGIDALVEVDVNALAALAWQTQFFWNEFTWAVIHLLEPDAVLVNLRLDIAVG